MKCPRCAGQFERVQHGAIMVDRCQTCKGLWFDIFEAEALKKVRGSATIDIGSIEEGQQFIKFLELTCPKCYTKMTPLADQYDETITYQKCPVCYGAWFDAGTFTHFRNNGFFSAVKRLFVRNKER